jgi:FixJ family two-component response regulator
VSEINVDSVILIGQATGQAPETNRWSLSEMTGCGQLLFSRPCQQADCSAIPASSYPHAPICHAPREMVFVVDDDESLRYNMLEMIEGLGYPAMGFGSSAQLFAELPNYDVGCVLLDIRLPGEDGLAIQESMNKSRAPLPIVFISGVNDISTVVHCMKAGAFEFLQKPFGEMQLRAAVSVAVGRSRMRFCQSESLALVRRMITTLTPTEASVATMISRGLSTKMIAAETSRSENTIKIHRHRIFQKFKVNSAASVANIMRHSLQDQALK